MNLLWTDSDDGTVFGVQFLDVESVLSSETFVKKFEV